MLFLNQLLTIDSENEHVLEHDLLKKKIFSPPKIYTANGDCQNVGMFTFLIEIQKQENFKE